MACVQIVDLGLQDHIPRRQIIIITNKCKSCTNEEKLTKKNTVKRKEVTNIVVE